MVGLSDKQSVPKKVPEETPPVAGLSDLSFEPGIKFAATVSDRFRCSVSPSKPTSNLVFHLVVSFGRSALGAKQVISMSSFYRVGCLASQFLASKLVL